jgi:predicted RNA-binding Zn-ribbon protein involved in translation (DUF1610 family)
MIRVKCPACGSSMTAPDTAMGKKASCPKCGQKLLITRPNPTMMTAPVPEPPPIPAPPSISLEPYRPPYQPPPEPPPEAMPFVLPVAQPAPQPAPQPMPQPSQWDFSQAEEPPPPQHDRRDDYDRRPPRRAGEFRCPFCGTNARPYIRKKISTGGWVLFVVLLIGCFLASPLALLMTEEYRTCSACGINLG